MKVVACFGPCLLPGPRAWVADLADPRRETKNKQPKLKEVVMALCCAVLSGIEAWVGLEDCALDKAPWLRGVLERTKGIPSPANLG